MSVKTDAMHISVVIPCHNAEQWIDEALRSVAEQTYPPREIIVVDDASTDASVRRIGETGIDVKLLHTQHGNAAAARNAGIEVATSDWIAFQDADDLWYAHHLERAVQLLQGSSDVALQTHSDHIRRGEGIIRRRNPWPVDAPTSGLPAERFVDFFRQHLEFCMPSVVVRRDVLMERGMFNPELVRRHDMDMWLRVTQGHTWAYDPIAHLACRADTPGSISRTNYASSEYWHLRMLLHHCETYDSPAMRWLIRRGARATMATALTDGGPDDRRLARQLAWWHLDRRDRLLFRSALCWPGAFAMLNHLRRRRHQRRRQRHQIQDA